MANTRHILFLVTTIISYIGSTNGGYYAEHSNIQNNQNQNQELLSSNIENTALNNENHPNDVTNQSLDGKLKFEESDASTRYELDQTVPQNINEEQYRNVINQLESEVHKPEKYYSNQAQSIPNSIQNANIPTSVIQQRNTASASSPTNQHNSVQSVNSNQIISQSDSIRTTHLRSFYPPLFPNYANHGIIPAQSNVYSHPLSPTSPQVIGHQIPQVSNVLPNANIASLSDQSNNLIALPLTAPPTVSGRIPVVANIQNVLPQASVGLLPTHSINVHQLPVSQVHSLVQGNQVPVNYNLQNVLPQASVGVIPAQPSPGYPLSVKTSQALGGGNIPVNSDVHILPQENAGILSAQPNSLLLPVNQQISVSGYRIQNNFNVENVPPVVNAPVAGQYILNGASAFSNIASQRLQPLNVPQALTAPKVTKAIYFHAAPPGFEDAPAPTLPPKKTYKIIFIKLPSQERKNTALLQSLYNQYAAREDKTLIYVLVQKPEEQQVIVPQPKAPSEHEVIFVKYKNLKENSATVGTNEAETKHDDRLLLKPGLINGH